MSVRRIGRSVNCHSVSCAFGEMGILWTGYSVSCRSVSCQSVNCRSVNCRSVICRDTFSCFVSYLCQYRDGEVERVIFFLWASFGGLCFVLVETCCSKKVDSKNCVDFECTWWHAIAGLVLHLCPQFSMLPFFPWFTIWVLSASLLWDIYRKWINRVEVVFRFSFHSSISREAYKFNIRDSSPIVAGLDTLTTCNGDGSGDISMITFIYLFYY